MHYKIGTRRTDMERLTEHHFKKQDGFYMKCSEHCCKEDFSCEDCGEFDKLVDRLGAIEDILGDEYDLDSLRELKRADDEGRCVVLPAGGYTDKDGENALKSAMNTCFYHNNPVTRFISDAVAEKLTHEEAEATLRREQDEKGGSSE
jgi:hypothetical protein